MLMNLHQISLAVWLVALLVTPLSAANVQIKSLQESSEVPLQADGTNVRFSNFSNAAGTTPGFILFEGIRQMEGNFGNWAVTSYTGYSDSGAVTGETGVAVLEVTIPQAEANAAYSDIVGIMPVTKHLGDMTATEIVPTDPSLESGQAQLLHGRMLLGFNGGETTNLGYTVIPNASLSPDPFDLATSQGTVSVNDLSLVSAGNGTELAGVFGGGANPSYAFSVSGLTDSDSDTLPDAIDDDTIFFESAPLLGGSWRLTDQAEGVRVALGMIFEDNFPWVYSYRFNGGSWLWIYDQGSRDTFWAYNATGGYWAWINLTQGRWFYNWTTKAWARF